MRVLSVVRKYFYGRVGALEPMYLEFTEPLTEMGHQVDSFDHVEARTRWGSDGCGDRFLEKVRNGGYDVVLYQTAGQDWMPREAIREAGRHVPVIAWNSDDDWQWDDYTMDLAPYFTFMATTYPHVYEANRSTTPNLLLSQWGCYTKLADFGRRKDLDFTFVGQVYGQRNQDCRYLRKNSGLRVYGLGSRLVNAGLPYFRGMSRIKALYGEALTIEQVNEVWNRSKVSYTPMGASKDPGTLQIKGRVFQMGLSGTLMLTQLSPGLERYYDQGKEFIAFETVEDCVEKAQYYLVHEEERSKIARAYRDRTLAEHLWSHRFSTLFRDAGLGRAGW